MRTNTLVTLGASAGFGILAIFLAKGWISGAVENQFESNSASSAMSQNVETRRPVDTKTVLLADTDLRFGDMLAPQNLREVDMPEDLVPEGAFTSFEALFDAGNGRNVVLSRMDMNEPILDYKISGPGGRGSLSSMISEGKRAYAIQTNAVAGVAGFVLPGDHVDVILTRDFVIENDYSRLQIEEMRSDILLQNVKVLGVDQRANTDNSDVKVSKTVTLEVSSQESQKLALAAKLGTLSLTLRQIGMQEVEPNTSLSQNDIYAQTFSTAKPRGASSGQGRTQTSVTNVASAAPSTARVTVIRGQSVDSVSVLKDITITRMDDTELAGAAQTTDEGQAGGYITSQQSTTKG